MYQCICALHMPFTTVYSVSGQLGNADKGKNVQCFLHCVGDGHKLK